MDATDLCYESERVLVMRGFPRRFIDIKSAQEYADHIRRSRWFESRWPHVSYRPLPVKRNMRSGWSWYNPETHELWLSRWEINDLTILHELAHVIEYDPDHGEDFRRTYIALVRRFMGREPATSLRYAFLAHGLTV